MRPAHRRLDLYTSCPCMCTLILLAFVPVTPWIALFSLSGHIHTEVTVSLARVCNVTTVTRGRNTITLSSTCVAVRGACPSLCGMSAGCGGVVANASVPHDQRTPWTTSAREQMCATLTYLHALPWSVAMLATLWLCRNAVRVHFLSVYIERQHQQPYRAFTSSSSWSRFLALSVPQCQRRCGDDLGNDWRPTRAITMTLLAGALSTGGLAVHLTMLLDGLRTVQAWVAELCLEDAQPTMDSAADAAFWRDMLCVAPVRVQADLVIALVASSMISAAFITASTVVMYPFLRVEWRSVPQHEPRMLSLSPS